jgi:hypothetical protein
MRVRVLKPFTKFKSFGPAERGQILDLPQEDAEALVRNGLAEPLEAGPGPVGGEKAGGEPDPRLVAWLQHRGFRRLGDKPVWTKHDKVGGRIARLCVDFQDNPWGSRIAYALDEGTGEWAPSRELRDAEELLAYKSFRDELRRGEGEGLAVRPAAAPAEAGAGSAGGAALAVGSEQELVLMVERRDEDQITREMLGEVLREYVYRIPGLRPMMSYAGIKEAARRRGNIHVTRVEVGETGDGQAYVAKAEVYDLANNFKVWGVAVQRKRMRLRDGTEAEDDFAITKACSKAIRNGLRACIPEKLIAELTARWLEEHGGEGR